MITTVDPQFAVAVQLPDVMTLEHWNRLYRLPLQQHNALLTNILTVLNDDPVYILKAELHESIVE